ncbi:MAG: hypothetical protein H6839_14725 [Planctomycetes bacterium]|nr:hypothetical protein [Planctomycetota bacterium]
MAAARALHAAARHAPDVELVDRSTNTVAERGVAVDWRPFLLQINNLVREVDVECSRLIGQTPMSVREALAEVLRASRAVSGRRIGAFRDVEGNLKRLHDGAKRLRIGARKLGAVLEVLSQEPMIIISDDNRRWARGGAVAEYNGKKKPVTKAQVSALLELGRTGKCRAPYKAIDTAQGLIALLTLPDGLISRKDLRTFRGKIRYEAIDLRSRVSDHRTSDKS